MDRVTKGSILEKKVESKDMDFSARQIYSPDDVNYKDSIIESKTNIFNPEEVYSSNYSNHDNNRFYPSTVREETHSYCSKNQKSQS